MIKCASVLIDFTYRDKSTSAEEAERDWYQMKPQSMSWTNGSSHQFPATQRSKKQSWQRAEDWSPSNILSQDDTSCARTWRSSKRNSWNRQGTWFQFHQYSQQHHPLYYFSQYHHLLSHLPSKSWSTSKKAYLSMNTGA